jgi:predicted helicase
MRTIDEYLKDIREKAWNTSQLGRSFERFVKKFLKTDPVYAQRYTDVWLWEECPFAKGHDVGIDLVAKTRFGEYEAIQAKCYRPGTQVDKKDVDTFLSASGKRIYPGGTATHYAGRIIIATNDNWTTHASEAIQGQQIPVVRIGLNQIRAASIDWGKFFADAASPVAKKTLRPHQRAALEDVAKGFATHDRGQLIMACGTGKTFTSLKIAEALCPERGQVLFLVPSIALLGQTLREWCEQAERPLTAFAVCSDEKVTKPDSESSLEDLGFPATTSARQLVRYGKLLKAQPPEGLTVVFSTYQSIDAVHGAQAAGAFGTFDLVVCDEAHRTTGAIFQDRGATEFTRIHDADYIHAARRLYMTATPRIYGENAKKKADDEFIALCSMDDESIYGPEFHHLTFSAAVSQELLTDYKVLILAVDERDMRDLPLADRDGDGTIDDVDQLAKIVGTWKGLNKRVFKDDDPFLGGDKAPMRSAVAFTTTIADSVRFAGQFRTVVEEHFGEDENLQPVEIHHVDGGMDALRRARELAWLREAGASTGCRILSNAKCLSEGVDVPGLDAVIFLSPKSGYVDVVQAIGRVMRRAEGKQTGYIIIPVMIPMGMDATEALSTNKRFKVIWNVLSAIRSHDDAFNALDNKVDILRVEPPRKKPKGDYIPPEGGDLDDDEPLPEDEAPPPLAIDTERFESYKKAIHAKLVKVCGENAYWSVWAAEIADIVRAQIARITALLEDRRGPYAADFEAFHETLRSNLNKSVTRDEAIAMLAQQQVSAPIFDALFSDYRFLRHNPVSRALERLLARLDERIDSAERATLDKFYESVRQKAGGKTTAAQKQAVVVQLYNNFFNIAFKETVEKLGIVYTPVPVVDFIIRSVERILQKHFGHSVGDEGVHVLDPFTGTGTFVTRLLQSGLIPAADLPRKYASEIHANEIVLLAYYIAAINIESVYHDLVAQTSPAAAEGSAPDADPAADPDYHPFDGIVLTDTFQLGEEGRMLPGIFGENSARASDQKKLDIRVVIGNPPYSVAKGTAYPHLEERIADTYAKGSGAVNKNALYDSYIKAFRWASDRIRDEGVVAFVSNGGWIDAPAMNGFRNAFVDEFSHIYVFNLRGNQRTQGEASRREGGKIFGQGARTPIAITILVKTKGKTDPGEIHYHDIGDYLSRDEKLKILEDFGDIDSVPWLALHPDKHGDWLNQRHSEFDDFVPLAPDVKFDASSKSLFTAVSSGLKTGRDAWAVNFSRDTVAAAMEKTIDFYNKQLCAHGGDPGKVEKNTCISWNRSLLGHFKQKRVMAFVPGEIVDYAYRPFTHQYCYFDKYWNDMTYQMPRFFPDARHKNVVIWVTGIGGTKAFSCFISNCIPDIQPFQGGIQCFPLFWYEQQNSSRGKAESFVLPGFEEEGEWVRHDGVSDFALARMREIAGPGVTKEEVFYWVYGALHNPSWRERFAADLKKELPRLPMPSGKKEFERVQAIGRELALLHLNYETIEPWPLDELGGEDGRVEKMSWAKDGKTERRDMLVVNSGLTLAGIPAEAHRYTVNGRTPLEWLIDRYQVRTDAASGIVNDPNDWGGAKRIAELAKRLVRLSVRTAELVAQLGGENGGAVPAAPSPEGGARAVRTPAWLWKSGVKGVPAPLPPGRRESMYLRPGPYRAIETGNQRTEMRDRSVPSYDKRLGGLHGGDLRTLRFHCNAFPGEEMTWEVAFIERDDSWYTIHLGKRLK